MAIDVFSLTGKIAVEYSDAQTGLDRVASSASQTATYLSKTASAADDAEHEIDDAGDAAKTADGQFSTWKATIANLASQAITALISKCTELANTVVQLGIDTETAFAKLETIAGAENVDDLKESISALATETGISSATLADVAYNAISAGASAETAMDMVTAATKLGVAGFTDTSSALSVLSTAMNSYGDSCGTVAEISDSLIMVQNLGVTTIDELSSYIGKAIATGSAYSVSLGNLESAYVSVTKAGISTAEATTYINSMMNELGDAGSDVSAILEEQTGKSFTELMNEGYSLADVLEIIYDSVEGDSTALMNLWSSAEAGKASNAIVNQGLEEFNKNLETITSTAGATEDAYAIMADTMATKISVMKQNFAELGLQIYERFEEPLTDAISFVTDTVIPGIQYLVDNFDQFAPVLAAVTAALIAYKAAMGITSLIKALTTATQGTTIAQMALKAVMNANPFVLIVTLIAGLVAALVVLWNTNEDFRNAVIAVWEKVKAAFRTAVETVSGIMSGLVEGIQAAWETICNAVEIAVLLIASILDAAVQIITLPFAFIWENCKDIILAAWDAITSVVDAALTTIQSVISTVFNAVKDVISDRLNTIKTTVSTVLNAVQSAFSTVFNAVKSTVTNVLDNVKNTISSGINSAKSTVTSVLDSIKSKFSSTFDSVKSIVSNAITNIKSLFNFTWSLPNIKLPHFSIKPSGWSIGDLLKGSIPTLGISWYAKAMDDGMIMNSPTIFGVNGSQLMAGGEAGSETVVGTDSLMNMVRTAVREERDGMGERLEEILDLLSEALPALISGQSKQLVLDTGMVVGSVDSKLGIMATRKGRGN